VEQETRIGLSFGWVFSRHCVSHACFPVQIIHDSNFRPKFGEPNFGPPLFVTSLVVSTKLTNAGPS